MAHEVAILLAGNEAEEVRAAVLAGLRAFNREHAEPPDFQPLTLCARDAGGVVVGGLVGETGWRWLHVNLLWVAASHRRQGVGRHLLRDAEKEARRRRCTRVYLDTFDFQARPFYEREGYSEFGLQQDYPPGSARYYLQKSLLDGAGQDE